MNKSLRDVYVFFTDIFKKRRSLLKIGNGLIFASENLNFGKRFRRRSVFFANELGTATKSRRISKRIDKVIHCFDRVTISEWSSVISVG